MSASLEQNLLQNRSESEFIESFQPRVAPRLSATNHTPSSDLLVDGIYYGQELTVSGILLLLTLAIFNIWIILTNVLLVIGIWKKGRDAGVYPTDCYLMNLSIIDICAGILVLPLMTTVVVVKYFPFSGSLCAAWIYWDYFLIVVSSYGYAALFLNHFIMVRAPGKYRDSLQSHILTIGFLWIAANLSWGPTFLQNLSTESNPIICGYEIDKSSYYTMYVGITGFYIPLLISIICPIYGGMQLRKKSHNRLFYNTGSQFISRSGTVNTKQRNWSLAVIMETNQVLLTQNQARKEQPLLLALLASFLLSRILFFVYFGVGAFFPRVFPPDLTDGVYWLIHSNAAFCPVIHVVLDSHVRGALRSFCCSLPSQKNRTFPSEAPLTVSACSEINFGT